jgi:hypothetical protein
MSDYKTKNGLATNSLANPYVQSRFRWWMEIPLVKEQGDPGL